MVNRAEEGCPANYLAGGSATPATGTYSSRGFDESPCREIRAFTINGELTRAGDAEPDVGYPAPDSQRVGRRSVETDQAGVDRAPER